MNVQNFRHMLISANLHHLKFLVSADFLKFSFFRFLGFIGQFFRSLPEFFL